MTLKRVLMKLNLKLPKRKKSKLNILIIIYINSVFLLCSHWVICQKTTTIMKITLNFQKIMTVLYNILFFIKFIILNSKKK